MDTSRNMLRNQIRDIRKIDCYNTIGLCNKYLEEYPIRKEDIWFANHNLSKMYKQIGNIDLAIKYSMLALQNVDEDCPDYILTAWMLGCCLEENNDIEGAIREYTKCSKLYRSIGEQYHRICIIFNIAKLKGDVRMMLKVIHIAESNNLDRVLEDYKDLDNVIYKMCTELIDYCIFIDNTECIFKIVSKINNKNLKTNVKKYYFRVA